ncbi:hypothetical protein PMAL9190_00368 [Photobacterium malacitanum]|uniref:Uncharacterized protein n=1 Tax=Photobacterium malacitanum TaxID=2204294 RepID=A0A1Y6M6E0_9GAMM|nr:hypothetical protein [Photobacterium malacitanum]SMY32124.1 hypothetical protein PMAL9190_00368 [Photobacterium malacitanum]
MKQTHYRKTLISIKIMRDFIKQKILNNDLSDINLLLDIYDSKITELSVIINLKTGGDI